MTGRLALWLVWSSLACTAGPAARVPGSVTGTDSAIEGVLHVAGRRAFVDHEGQRFTLIDQPAQTATSYAGLVSETADHLKKWDGRRVQVSGQRQDSTMWAAVVTPIGRSR